MKKLLIFAVLAGLTIPFGRMIYDMAANSKQYEVGISTSQINPKPEVKYFSVK
jgi:hypothetical protein